MINLVNLTDKFPLINKTIKIKKVPIEIKTYLSIEDFATAVETIVDNSFSKGEYRPEYKEIAKRYTLLKFFTDINVDDIETGELFKITQSEWYLQILHELETIQIYYDLENAAEEAIRYRIEARQTAFDKLCLDFSNLINSDVKTNIDDIIKVIEGLNSVDKDAFVDAAVKKLAENK